MAANMSRQPGRLFALCLASIALIGPLAIHIYLPMIPAVKAGLELSNAMAQLTFSVSIFGLGFSTLVWGALSDRHGRRPVLLSGLCLFLVGGIACAFAPNVELLVLGRLVQAIGAGAGAALVRPIARDAYGPDQMVKAIAYLTMFYTLGPMIAPIVGGFLVDGFGWRSVFAFSVAAGALIAFGAWRVIYETKPPAGAGAPPQQGMARNFVELFSHLRFTCFVLQTGFNTGAFLVAASAASFLMKETLDRPASEFGLWFLTFPLGYFAGNFISSRIGGRVANETMVLLGSSLALVAVLAQSVILVSGYITPSAIFLPCFFITCAQGLSLPYGQAGAMAIIPRIAGTAAGVGVFVQNVVGALFAQLYGLLADGSIWPIVLVTIASASLGVLAAIPLAIMRARRQSAL